MSETLVAAPSTAEVDVFNGEQPSMAEYTQYRQSGEVPERFKPAETVADPAPAEEEESEAEEAEIEPESDPEEQQEKPSKKGAEFRIKQLLAEKKRLETELARRPTQAEPSPAKPVAPQNYQDYRKTFKPSEWVAEYGKKNPNASYEDATAAMADHLADVRDQFRTIEQQRQSQAKELNDKVSDARARYGENFDEVLAPTVNTIVNDATIPQQVKDRLNRSGVLPDLMFTLGSDPEALASFQTKARTDPWGAIDYIVLTESLIREELAAPESKETARNEQGQFTAPPAKPKTSAPKPPSPVSGASTGAFDVSDESLSNEEWARKRNEQLAKRR